MVSCTQWASLASLENIFRCSWLAQAEGPVQTGIPSSGPDRLLDCEVDADPVEKWWLPDPL